jgi:hypothetical protein
MQPSEDSEGMRVIPWLPEILQQLHWQWAFHHSVRQAC